MARSTPLQPAAAPPPALAITPLPGMAARHSRGGGGAAAAAGEVTPVQQQPQQEAVHAVGQGMQQLAITPLGGSLAGGAHGGSPQPQHHQRQHMSPLEQLAAAAPPAGLNITPLAAPPAARQQAASGAGAGAGRPPPPPLAVSPLGGLPSDRPAPLAISPLPGMRAAPAAASPLRQQQRQQQQQQRSVLGERTNSPCGVAGHDMLPALPSPLPAAPEPPLQASPSFAENLPLPSPGTSPRSEAAAKQQPAAHAARDAEQQHAAGGAGGLAGHKIKAASAAVAQASPAGSGSMAQWSIGAVPADAEAAPPAGWAADHHQQPAAAAAAADTRYGQYEFSFAAAQRSYEALSGGAGVGPVAGGGSGAQSAVPPAGLRDDIWAMHLDMITQFQVGVCCGGRGGGVCSAGSHAGSAPLLWFATHPYPIVP